MENTEFTEVFNRFFSVIFVVSVVKKPLRNSLLGIYSVYCGSAGTVFKYSQIAFNSSSVNLA